MENKHLLIITRNLPPLVGGMERLNWHIIQTLATKNTVHVICPTSSDLPESGNDAITYHEAPLKPLILFFICTLIQALKAGIQKKPHIVLAGSGLMAPIAWITAKLYGAQSITYIHGLDIIVNHPIYQKIWLPFIRRQDQLIANSNHTLQLAKNKGVAEEKIQVLHPGVSLACTNIDEKSFARFRSQYEIQDQYLFISVGRLTQRKGLREFVDAVFPQILKKYPSSQLVIVGNTPIQALNGKTISQMDILDIAKKHHIDTRIKFLGHLSEEELSIIYTIAHVHVFPIQEVAGDIEGFGMVAIEAASYGTPTVAFKVGGVIDAVRDGVSGYLIEPNHFEAFAASVCQAIETPLPKAPIQAFAAQFEWQHFGNRINQLVHTSSSSTNASTENRQPHAVLDLASRKLKGMKIEKILHLNNNEKKMRLLEIGTGSGGIAHYFACQTNQTYEVVAVDTLDQRLVKEGYQFVLVKDTHLPFANESFDIVISNHCIEHVGEDDAQKNHLHEIKRVLKKEGVGYLAVPNRWMLIEPHYQLIFLSWLPKKWRTPYLQWAGKGKIYDCEPLAVQTLETLLNQTGFHFKNQSVEAIYLMHQIEPDHVLASIIAACPRPFLEMLKPIIPTLIYTLHT
jgi:phosphatidyl-myo-inositol dimannoside synthase